MRVNPVPFLLPAAILFLAPAAPALDVADAEFDLCVRNVGACAKFYRDGLGMREVEPGALLEWAGCRLRLRKIEGTGPAPAPGNPMRQMLAQNGFRWFSLWFKDPAAAGERLVQAGYPAPMKGGRVSMTRDPDGNVVELMGIPRSADAETFTWGMAVSDDAAARKFYGATLGLHEFEPWNLPPPVSTKMYLFATGGGRVKFAATPGDRPRESEAGPDAPGLRSVTLRVADLKAARAELEGRGAAVAESAGRLLLTDPDGNRIYVAVADARPGPRTPSAKPEARSGAPATEARPAPAAGTARGGAAWASPANAAILFRQLDRDADGKLTADEVPRDGLFRAIDKDGNGSVTPAEARAYLETRPPRASPAETPPAATLPAPPSAPGEPAFKAVPDSDAARDAAGRGQLFESIVVPGLTDLRAGMNGLAIADLNRDGRLDLLATFSPQRGTGGRWEEGELLRVFLNEGAWKFREHALTLRDTKFTMDAFGRGQVPALADFNGDGFLDLFVTRHARMSAGKPTVPGAESEGNSLFVTDGAWDVLREVSAGAGIRNELAYNRQPVLGDVNRDGWLDVAVGCDNIKNAMGGVPHSRLFVFNPDHHAERDDCFGGAFRDIGGTDLVPDFGGFHHDSAKDKAGPDINLRDLDNDGDLDLVQTFHVDVREPLLPYWPGEYRQGVFCWKNLLAESGSLRFEKVTGNGLACEARLRYDREKQVYVPEGKAPGLPYVAIEDFDNDGLADVVAVGPASPGWAPRAEYVGGRYWRNLGGFRFEERTKAAGLEALEWTYLEWAEFFGFPVPSETVAARPGRLQTQPGMDRPAPASNRPYFADAIPADFNNDGRLDLVVQDRHEGLRIAARAILFLNRGDGTFEPQPTTFSGLDDNGICGEAADLDNDGLLDLVFAADPDNSGLAQSADRYESKVYWNTGLHGARSNHWLRLRFAGVKDAELIGARVEIAAGDLRQTRWVHANHSYKSGGALEVHAGLGPHAAADVKVTLPGGRTVAFAKVKADRYVEADLTGGGIRDVALPVAPSGSRLPAAASKPVSEPAPVPATPAGRKPDIVILLADDLGYAGTGFNGCPDIPTPHIDSIAKNGVRFTDGYATHPVCSPSRAGLMSGMYQHRFGFEHNSGPERFADPGFGLPREVPTLAEKLKAAGYATGMVGKWHIGFQEGLRPHERGFDFHYGFLSGARTYMPGKADNDPIIRNGVPVTNETEYLTDALAREAVAFLDRTPDTPAFLYVAFNAVHSPMEATDPYLARFPALAGNRRTHAAMVSAMDDAVGRVMGKLRAQGREDNALVFFYSDNGGPTAQTTASNAPLRGFKGQMLEGGIRVPFAMQWKSAVPGGRTYREMVMAFDIHATALAASSHHAPRDAPQDHVLSRSERTTLDGVDLVPFVTGRASGAPHDRLFWRSGEKHAARLGDWKLVQDRDGEAQLFNLQADIGEATDLAATKPEKLKELRAAFDEWEKGTQPAKWVRQDGRTAGPARSGAGGGIEERFRQFDRNRDGRVSREELPIETFDRADTDKDGFLSLDEARAHFGNARRRTNRGTE